MRKSAVLALSATCIAVGGVLASAPASAAAPEEITVHVDANAVATASASGLSAQRAVRSIADAERVVRNRGAVNATVLLHGGTYYPTSPIHWTYAPAGGHITFGTEPGTGRVVIDGSRLDAGAVAAEEARAAAAGGPAGTLAAGYGLTVDSGDNGTTISGYTFEHFLNGGIRVSGQSAARASNIIISGNTIEYIGTKYNTTGTGTGYGGVHVTYASGTKIQDNHFYYLENTDSPASVHGVYLANDTNSTTMSGNRFGYISGDPIRTRNASDNNAANSNMFWHAGSYAIFSDWRFDSEKCGTGNTFTSNKVGNTTYNGDEWNVDAQGSISPVRVRLWGHDDAKNANVGGCSTDPITFGGGNVYVSTKPW